ncbi:methyl-accepting chemotaxis protein, partial [Thauera mechernichensis]
LAATAEELGGQAGQLQELMDFFTLEQSGGRGSSASPTTARGSLNGTASKLAVKDATPAYQQSGYERF